mgnify:CR=1 FL=1
MEYQPLAVVGGQHQYLMAQVNKIAKLLLFTAPSVSFLYVVRCNVDRAANKKLMGHTNLFWYTGFGFTFPFGGWWGA